MSIGSILLSVISGGASGILGGAIQSVFSFLGKNQELKGKELDHKFQIDLVHANAEVMTQEWAQRAKVAEIEGETAKDVEASKAFAAGFASEPKMYSEHVQPTSAQGWMLIAMDLFKAIIRPALTLYLCAVATMMYIEAKGLLVLYGKAMSVDQAFDIHQAVAGTLLYLFNTCVCWWFYQRAVNNAKK